MLSGPIGVQDSVWYALYLAVSHPDELKGASVSNIHPRIHFDTGIQTALGLNHTAAPKYLFIRRRIDSFKKQWFTRRNGGSVKLKVL